MYFGAFPERPASDPTASSGTHRVLRPGELRRLLDHFSSRMDLSGNAPEAVVVGCPLDYSVAELYRELAERCGYEVGVYWRMEEALEALGLDVLPEALIFP